MKNKILNFAILSLILLFSNCNKQENKNAIFEEKSYTQANYEEEKQAKQDYVEQQRDNQLKDQDPSQSNTGLTDDEIKKIGKKIIKNASLSIEAKDYNKTLERIKNITKKYDCSISEETQNTYSTSISGTLTIRVKSAQFDSLMAELLTGDEKIVSKNIYINDVTEQYVDLYSRLKNKKIAEQQYQEIMKKAYSVNDILNVQEYLRRIREEIEATQGRMKFIDNQVDYSTINISLTYNGPDVNNNTFWDMLLKGLEGGWTGIKYFVIAIFYVWPLWILLGIIIFAARRISKKKQNKKQQ